MEELSYLIFELQGIKYAIAGVLAVEVLWLPECRPVEEAPSYIAGLLNLHGKIIPVIDIHIRFGRTPKPYKVTDRIIIVEVTDTQIGLIVNDIIDVYDFAGIIEATPEYGLGLDNCDHFVTQIAKLDEEVIMIIDIERLFRCSKQIHQELTEGHEEANRNVPLDQINGLRLFCPEATEEDRKIFRQRAKDLAVAATDSDKEETVDLAVVKLADEFFGIDLRTVKEFITIRNIMPIPCCPPYVLGDINLRGDILSIIDVRSILNLPNSKTYTETKGIVIQLNEYIVGIPIDEILDIAYVTSKIIADVPVALASVDEEYLIGTVKYGSGMLAILDLQKILLSPAVIVNQEV
ncbi:MAG: chemotaxis protein CheW [Nitrospirae bacterium]|nr:chemotaxis protein CheW [Nitrospirota bacterium]